MQAIVCTKYTECNNDNNYHYCKSLTNQTLTVAGSRNFHRKVLNIDVVP